MAITLFSYTLLQPISILPHGSAGTAGDLCSPLLQLRDYNLPQGTRAEGT